MKIDFPATDAYLKGEAPLPWTMAVCMEERWGMHLIDCFILDLHLDCCLPLVGAFYSDQRYLLQWGDYEDCLASRLKHERQGWLDKDWILGRVEIKTYPTEEEALQDYNQVLKERYKLI